MKDPFVPEADAVDQEREVMPTSPPADDEHDDRERALEYPRRMPSEVPEADLLEQTQTVEVDEEFDR